MAVRLFQRIIFLLIAGFSYGSDAPVHAQIEDICRTIDYVRIYDRLDALDISVTSLVIEPLSAFLRASSRKVDGDPVWPADAAVLLFADLPGSVRQIHIDDQTTGSRHGSRTYTSDAFRQLAKPYWILAKGSGIRTIGITGSKLSLFTENILQTDIPEFLVRLGASFDDRQAIASASIYSEKRQILMEKDFPKWQRLARNMQVGHLYGDDFLLSSVTSSGVHLTAKIRGNGSGSEKTLLHWACFNKQADLYDYSTFSTVTVP